MLLWIEDVLKPYLQSLQWWKDGNPVLLIMDADTCHWNDAVTAKLESLRVHRARIPVSLTWKYQIIDVIVVAQFKNVLYNL